jgi:hypothetical protein
MDFFYCFQEDATFQGVGVRSAHYQLEEGHQVVAKIGKGCHVINSDQANSLLAAKSSKGRYVPKVH